MVSQGFHSPQLGKTARHSHKRRYNTTSRVEFNKCGPFPVLYVAARNRRNDEGSFILDTQELIAQCVVISAIVACIQHVPGVQAYENVRVEDVENDILQAGLLAAEAKNYEAAERFFQTYLKQEDPNSASGYSNLGNVHMQMGKTRLALEDYNHAVALAPEAAVPLLNRGLAYEQLGVQYEASNNMSKANDAWEQGRLDLKTAIQLDPQEFAAYYDLGLIEMRLQRYDDASVHLQQAADLAPGIAGYRVRSAALLFQTGDDQKAASQLRGVVRKYGNYAEAHAALASVLKSQGKFGQAEEEIAKAVELDPLWADPVEVKKNTRWPPKLYAAHEQLIKIS
ncbi:hypothetical protein M9434_006342 [Picochlorum sp. BPE23]|nr:hypothetical protein M9434_006342 [Picochlorum sp. BPE23]